MFWALFYSFSDLKMAAVQLKFCFLFAQLADFRLYPIHARLFHEFINVFRNLSFFPKFNHILSLYRAISQVRHFGCLLNFST